MSAIGVSLLRGSVPPSTWSPTTSRQPPPAQPSRSAGPHPTAMSSRATTTPIKRAWPAG